MRLTGADQLLQQGRSVKNSGFLIAIRCLGSRVQLLIPDASWVPDLIDHLPPQWQPDRPGELTEDTVRYPEIWQEFPTAENVLNRETILRNLGSELEYAIAERSETFVFVHAGVVAIDDQVLIFPGESFAGKSTLVAALVHRGATYYSDEYAVATAEGLVLPFLRQIALRNSIFYPEGRTDLSAHAPDDDTNALGVAPRLILFSEYRQDHTWSCNPMDRTSALIELCKNTVGFRERPDMSFAHLNRLLDFAPAYIGTRSEATEAAERILAFI